MGSKLIWSWAIAVAVAALYWGGHVFGDGLNGNVIVALLVLSAAASVASYNASRLGRWREALACSVGLIVVAAATAGIAVNTYRFLSGAVDDGRFRATFYFKLAFSAGELGAGAALLVLALRSRRQTGVA